MVEAATELQTLNMEQMCGKCTAFKTKTCVEKKGKPPRVKVIMAIDWEVGKQFGNQQDLQEVFNRCFLKKKWTKSLGGPPPSVLEKNIGDKIKGDKK